MKVIQFLKNTACGAAIGVAMIIPGVSGGTVAVLLNIYDGLISALADLRKDFKKNAMFLLPIFLGAVLAFAAMYFPLKWALDKAPLPTVMLFAGLMAGSFPKLFKDSLNYGFKKINVLSVILPLLAIVGICVIKLFCAERQVDLTPAMPVWGYFAVAAVAMLASCALIIPGVSGSMLLMLLGYYTPVLALISGLKDNFGHSLLVLAIFALGLIVGFFTIAKLMKFFLKKYPRGTHWVITGFVAGSLPAVFIVFDYSAAPNAIHIAVGCFLLVLGAIATYALTAYMDRKTNEGA